MISSDSHALVGKILASGRQVVIAVTGGGSGAISALVQTPGASRVVLEAAVPYSLAALVDWIGGTPDQACSEVTARAMAMAAFVRARRLAPNADSSQILGIGATASLATDRPKRGERRVHLAFQRFDRTWAGCFSLDEMPANRADDERAATELILSTIANGCGVFEPASNTLSAVGHGVLALDEQIELLQGARQRIILKSRSESDYFDENSMPVISLVFPGAFNPLHAGHLQMAEIAERRIGSSAAWELSITNVDKPPLDFLSIDERVEALRREDENRLIALTRAPTFIEKANLFPGATFVVGVDTIERAAEPRYYGGDAMLRDAALAEIARLGCRFLVFGREVNGKFMTLGDLNLPVELHRICDEVPPGEFREDVSSTNLRKGAP